MRLLQPARAFSVLTFLIAGLGAVNAQCTNVSPYPPTWTTPASNGTVTLIDGCNWQIEYSTIQGIVAGANYEFAYEGGAWITVRQGASNGTLLGYGPSPLTVAAATAQNLYAHWNTDSLCGTAQDCHASTVQLLGVDCTSPEALVTVLDDCQDLQFSVEVEVVSLGDATSVGLSWTVNGGAAINLSGLLPGTYVLGPFANLSLIDLTVVHAENAACNLTFLDRTSGPCAIQSCGPDTYTYCYPNNANYTQSYQGTSTWPLQLTFNSGAVSGSGNDALTIHDGLLPTDPVLFSGVGNAGNLAGISVLSTNPDHALTVRFTSNSSFSCGDGGVSPPWNYTVACLDCTPATVQAGPVTTDCDAQTFTVQVNVTDMGSAMSAAISNDVGVPPTFFEEPGTYIVGPFPVGGPVTLAFLDTTSLACNIFIGEFINGFCPLEITCGAQAIAQSYCYGESDTEEWLYQNTGTESLALLFASGSIESATFDHLTIYDGTDDNAPVLYDHTQLSTQQLAGLLVTSTGPALYMTMSSDNSVSCAGGQLAQWNWTVGCLDCEQPDADYAVELDCANSRFFIIAEIFSLGADSATITNNGGAPEFLVTGPGMYEVGPFNLGADVQVTIEGPNALCNVGSGILTNAPCPLIGCGPFDFEFCYPNNMDTTIVYQSPGVFPISLLFNSGTIDTFGDHIEVYDGPDFQSPLVYNGANNGDLGGLQFTSTNPQNALCVRFVSNGFTSCSGSGGETIWDWHVSCLDCTNPSATFNLVEDCLHHGYKVEVNVSDLGSASDLRITDSWSGDTLSGAGVGTTAIGPIPVGESAHITVLNGANPLCRISSEEFFLASDACVVTACDVIGVDYCYGNDDTVWFTYQSGDNVPLSLSFAYGQLLDGDELRIYNGLDETAQLVFAGNLGGDVTGLALSSSNPDNALMFQIVSDGSGSCATGEATTEIYWTVGCGLVGADENDDPGPAVFPNPASDEVFIRLPQGNFGIVRFELLDLTARLVRDIRFASAGGALVEIPVGDLPVGRYTARFTGTGGVWSTGVQVAR